MSIISKRISVILDSSFAHLLLASFLMFAACAVALGQGGVGSSRGLPTTSEGNNTIKGRVFFPTDTKEGTRIKVRLTSNDMVDQATSTDEDGTFTFNRLPAGHYTLIVEGGKDYDAYSEAVSIDQEASVGGRIQNIAINLRPKGTAAAISKIPKPARELYTKGMEAATKGDSKKAVEQFNAAVALYPEFGQAYFELGMQYMKLGQPDKAADAFQAALKITPDDPALRLNYGIALLNQKKFPEAEEQLRLALKKNNNVASGHMYLGLSLAKQNKLDEAITELQQAIKLGGNELSKAHYFLGGVYWQKGDFQHAADELEAYLKLTPKDPNADKLRATIQDLRSKKS